MYINTVILPTKIRSLIIQELQEATNKKVVLDSLYFNIFKGLVLKNFVLYDEKETFLVFKEGSCNFLIPPLFFKKIIIPTLKLKSLTVFLERRPDNTLNIMDLFVQPKTTKAMTQNKKFSLFIYKIAVIDSSVNFKDKSLPSEFSKTADNLNLILNLSLPASVKFNLNSDIIGESKTKLAAAGEYKLLQRELKAQVSIKDLSPQDFFSYYQKFGMSFTQGAIDTLLDIKFKEDIISADLETKSKDLGLSKNKVQAQINSDIEASLQYSLKDNQLKFSGSADIAKLDITGLESLDQIKDIKGKVDFDNAGFSTDRLTANVLGIPLEAKLRLVDFQNPFLNIDITSNTISLDYINSILKDRFKFILPADLQGEGKFYLEIASKLPFAKALPINGYLDISNATLKTEKLKSPFENISGRLDFSSNQLKWSELNFQYLGSSYKTEGSLDNFKAPQVHLLLSSNELFLESELEVTGTLINFSKFDGRYLNSDFSIKGNLDITDLSSLQANITAGANFDLKDLKEPLKMFKDKLEKIAPSGIINAKIDLNGNINDIKSCLIQAKLSSLFLSAYGLKLDKFSMDYHQENGLADIPLIHLFCYDGAIDLAAKINLLSENLPYWVSANIQDIKLEKLKLDTPAKEKDIAGTLKCEVKINGFYKDPSRVTGAGAISILEGKLWELNLFKGLGKFLFAKDFASIDIKEGKCDFLIQDKTIFTNNLEMKGEFINLTGPVKIDFDGSIDASLNVRFAEEIVPLSGTFKDITTAIIGQADRFGTIKITGNLKEPKYKFQPVAIDMLKAIKDAFFGK